MASAPAREVHEAYFQGETVPFRAERDNLIRRSFTIGPWRFGRRFAAKPRDGRLNLYVLSPGSQYSVDGATPFGFNCLINALPKSGTQAEWDVYWAVVLDPALTTEFRSEQDLLLATQAEFPPAEDYTPQVAPGREVLRRYLHVTDTSDLDRYRRKSGELPRVLIVPAHIVLRASAGAEQQPAHAQ